MWITLSSLQLLKSETLIDIVVGLGVQCLNGQEARPTMGEELGLEERNSSSEYPVSRGSGKVEPKRKLGATVSPKPKFDWDWEGGMLRQSACIFVNHSECARS